MASMTPSTEETPKLKVNEHVDYKNLPCPIPYEELSREVFMSLKPESFEGGRFDFNKVITPNFFLSHSVSMGPIEVPSQSPEPLKVPTSNYEFGANYIDPKMMLIGRISHDGRLSARVKYDLLDDLSFKANGQITGDPNMTHGMGTLDYKGNDYRAQVQFGSGALLGANYIQSVTPNLAMGGEIFYAGEHRKSGVGYAARYSNDKMVATGQVASTGMVALGYVQKVSERGSMGTELSYNYMSRDITASVGYDAIFRQARVRGKIDSNGVATALVEERLTQGLGFALSAELDHARKDYKFGFGASIGE